MKNIKCIIFDCDGVLVDSEAIANTVLVSMAKVHGLEMTVEQAMHNFNGRSLQDCFLHIEQIINKKLPEAFEKEYRKKTFEAFISDLKPVAGVRDFIDTLTVSYCVASSGPMEKIFLNLTATGLIKKFENKIFSSYEINSWKPEPEIFLHAAQSMGFSVNECVVIEDSKAGVISAVKGGFRVFALANEKNAQELINEGATVFYNFEELPDVLNNETKEGQ